MRKVLALLLAVTTFGMLLSGCSAKDETSSQPNNFQFNKGSTSSSLSTSSAGSPAGDSTDGTSQSGSAASGGKSDATKSTLTAKTTVNQNTNGMAVAKVKIVNGIPRLTINGQIVQPIMLAVNANSTDEGMQTALRQIKKAGDNGINLVDLTVDVSGVRYVDMYVDKLYKIMKQVYDANKNAKIIIRFTVNGPPNYVGVSDSAKALINGGSIPYNACSFSSDEWLEGAKKMARYLAQVVVKDDFINKMVIGYHPCAGDAGEWFGPEYWNNGMDTSSNLVKGFRTFLQKLYGNDAALRSAWGDNTVSLATVQPPHYADVYGGYSTNGQYLFTNPENQKIVDYFDYINQRRAYVINEIAKVIKQETTNNSLVIVFYGYHSEVFSAASASFGSRILLDSPYIDGLAGPVSYEDRNEGGMGAFMNFASATMAAGKLWIDEADYRTTFRTAEGINPVGGGQDGVGDSIPFIKTASNVYEVAKRQIGKQMVFATGTWYFDLVERGWYDDRQFWKLHGDLNKLAEKYANCQKGYKVEVAFVLDESAMSLAGDKSLSNTLLSQNRKVIYRSGLSYGFYLINDVIEGRVPDAKLYVMMNPWRIDSKTADKLKKVLHTSGKTTLWMVGAGKTSSSVFNDLTGLNITALTSGQYSSSITTVSNASSLLPGLRGSTDITGVGSSPLYTVKTDSGITVLGNYNSVSGKPVGYAMTTKNGWTSIFYGSPALTLEVLVSAARKAGANCFISNSSTSGDVLYANQNLAVLHTATAGKKTITFPAGTTDVYDYFANKWYSGSKITIDCRQYQTLYLFYGKKSDFVNAGIGK